MRIAHFSDIHFFKLCLNPLQIFSKQFLGNVNYFFRRRHTFNQAIPYQLIKTLKQNQVTHLIITGDYTCISSRQEFLKMQSYIRLLKDEGFKIYTLPGNHDTYTRTAERKKSFYKYLSPMVDFQGNTPFNLIDHRVSAHQLLDKWWLVCVDLAHATPYTQSTGFFAPETQENLHALLSSLPNNTSIIMASHFPYDYLKPRAELTRGDHLRKIVTNHPKIRIYMHGHRHKHRIEEGENGLLTIDSGSISLANASSFNLLELHQDKCTITQYSYQNSTWEATGVQKTARCLV